MTQSAINRVAMEIEANPDCGIVLTDVARHLPKTNGKRKNYSTIWRWASKGYAGILLETTLIGRCRYTSRQALRRFNRIRNAHAVAGPIITANLRLACGSKTNTAAKKYLEREGFLTKQSAVSHQPSTTESRMLNAERSKLKGLGHGHGTESGRLAAATG